jgi:hypothetical protein
VSACNVPLSPTTSGLRGLFGSRASPVTRRLRLELTDVRDGRLHLDGRVIRLAGPVLERVAARLDERASRWPATVNPHLFINWYTTVRETPVSSPWISHTLGTSPQAIREDHILDEALATAGTPAAFAICSASPSAAPNATPAPPKPARGAARSRAVSGQGRLSA